MSPGGASCNSRSGRSSVATVGCIARQPEWIVDDRRGGVRRLAGKTIFSAREAVVAELRASGDLDGEPTPTLRKANFYEKGDKPLEIVSTRQWYIRNGGRDDDLKRVILERGAELAWIPTHMKHRYDNWVSGLNGDWLISRQRFFGVPFPVWYTLDAEGEPDYDHPMLPREDEPAGGPVDGGPPGSTSPSVASPAASSPTRT